MKQYFLVYVTANDSPLDKDYINLFLSRKFFPGVTPVQLYIVVGSVRKFSRFHRWMLRRIISMLESGRHIQCKMAILKNNAGRDFGSVAQALKALTNEAQPEDYILVRNRSTWGPLTDGWYKRYIDLLDSSDQLGLVGSTINLSDHPWRKRTYNTAHVQTYVYASQWKYLSTLLPGFPGREAANHVEAILQGEIELSQEILKRGWNIAAFNYDGLQITYNNQNDFSPTHLKQNSSVGNFPIMGNNQVRNWKYYLKSLLILSTIIWYSFPHKSSCKWTSIV